MGKIQDGWQQCHVIPFELVGETLLSDDYAALAADAEPSFRNSFRI